MRNLKQIIADSLISYSADDIPLLEIFHDPGKRRREVYPTLLKVLTLSDSMPAMPKSIEGAPSPTMICFRRILIDM